MRCPLFTGETTSSSDVSYLLEEQHPHQTSLIYWRDSILIRRPLFTGETTSSSDVSYLLEIQHPHQTSLIYWRDKHPHQTSLIDWRDNIFIRRPLFNGKTTSSLDVPYLLERQHPHQTSLIYWRDNILEERAARGLTRDYALVLV